MKKINYVYFEIKGLNQEKFFNSLSKKFYLYEINRLEKNRTSFKVSFFEGPKVKKEIISAGFEILKEQKKGPFFYLFNLFTSYGIIAGIVISLFLYFIQLPFIQKIEVWGIENSSQVVEFLSKNLPSKNRNKINIHQIESMISDNFDDISFISASIIGQSLIINLKEAIVPPEMNEVFSPLISPYDGVITDINLIQGTLNVSVGDIIQKGQILVEGKIINSEGEIFNIQPKAEISMNIWFEGEATHCDEEVVSLRTGNKIEKSVVSLFGSEFYSNNPTLNFSNYETETSTKYLSFNNILPFIVTKTIFYEIKTQTIYSSFDERKDEFIQKARLNCLQKLSGCEIIKEEKFRIIEGAGTTSVKYLITAEVVF